MPLDADLLEQAKTAEAHLIDAEHDAHVARAEFDRAVRRLKLAGGSPHEIAAALRMSHQRVDQIVGAVGGDRSWRTDWAGAGGLLSCSFCGKHQKQVRKLIAGPGVYICNECTERVRAVLAATGKTATTPIAVIEQVSDADRAQPCSFCGKQRHQVAGMASAGQVGICTECIGLCDEIILEELTDI